MPEFSPQDVFSPEHKAVAALVIGKSGTGKSSFIRHFSREKKQKLFLVGGDPRDYDSLDFESTVLTEDLKSCKDCTVVVDDLFQLTPKQHEILRHLLCFTKRHHNVTIFVAAHNFHFTGLLALSSHFDYIIFTRPKNVDNNIKLFLQRLQPEGITEMAFSSIPYQGYIMYSLQHEKFSVLDSTFLPHLAAKEEEKEKRAEQLKMEMGKILDVFPETKTRTECLFEYILRNLDPFLISTSDFCIRLAGEETNAIKVSLVDFLLISQNSHAKPSKNQFRLKRFMDQRFLTPNALIQNKYFLRSSPL